MATLIEKEIKEIARLIAGIERHSAENDPALDKQLEKIELIFKEFNKKYPRLALNAEKRIDSIVVNIFINESSVKKVFNDTASKINGLTGMGLTSFDEANLQEADKFASLVDKIKEAVFLTCSLDFGTETMVLEFNNKEKKVELKMRYTMYLPALSVRRAVSLLQEALEATWLHVLQTKLATSTEQCLDREQSILMKLSQLFQI